MRLKQTYYITINSIQISFGYQPNSPRSEFAANHEVHPLWNNAFPCDDRKRMKATQRIGALNVVKCFKCIPMCNLYPPSWKTKDFANASTSVREFDYVNHRDPLCFPNAFVQKADYML